MRKLTPERVAELSGVLPSLVVISDDHEGSGERVVDAERWAEIRREDFVAGKLNRPGMVGDGDLPQEKWSRRAEVRGREDPVVCLVGTRRNSVVRCSSWLGLHV